VWGFPINLKHVKITKLGLDLYQKLESRTIQEPLAGFGPNLVSKGVFLCCKTPSHVVEYDARMLGIEGEGLRIKDEAFMEDLVPSSFSKKRRGWGGDGGRLW
jgi:hypothetical protein